MEQYPWILPHVINYYHLWFRFNIVNGLLFIVFNHGTISLDPLASRHKEKRLITPYEGLTLLFSISILGYKTLTLLVTLM